MPPRPIRHLCGPQIQNQDTLFIDPGVVEFDGGGDGDLVLTHQAKGADGFCALLANADGVCVAAVWRARF